MLYLAELIKRAYRNNGVITAYVYGEFGFGKTSYALWTAYEVYGNWDEALKHLYFKPDEAIEALGEVIKSGKRVPLIIMDDAGLWLDRLTWYEESKIRFMELFNLIRSVAAGVIFTTPSEELPKQILNKAFYRIKIQLSSPDEDEYAAMAAELAKSFGLKPYVSKAVGYRLRTLPNFFKIVKKTYIDYYPTHYPILDKYERKRREALAYYYQKLREAVKTTKKPSRDEALNFIREELAKGTPVKEIAKKLMEMRIPKATAYRWVRKVREELAITRHP